MDHVLFDIDDTLYDQVRPFDLGFRETFGERFDHAGPDGGPLDVVALFRASRRHSEEVFEASERGEISMEEMYVYRIQKSFEDFGLDVSREDCLRMQEAYAANQTSAISVSPTMGRVLDWCVANASPGIVSNGPAAHQMSKVEALGLTRWVAPELVVISGAVGFAKPDPRIFRIACERAGTTPERCVYVGDSYDLDVVGAASAGMPVVWFNRRHNAAPQHAAARPDWTVSSEEGLLALLPTIS